MSKHKVTLIPGDGIGPEVSQAAKMCVEATGLDVEWEVFEAGSECLNKYGILFQDGLFLFLLKLNQFLIYVLLLKI